MEKETLFRTCFFGGYNKEDVKEYVKRLEEELMKAKAENEEINNRDSNPFEEKKREDIGVVIFDETLEKDASAASQGKKKEKQMSDENFEEMDRKLEKIKRELAEKEKEKEEKEKYYEKEIKELTEQNQRLQKEAEMLKSEKKDYDADYKAIKNVLLDARVDAEIIVSKARQQADLLMKEAQKEIEDKKKEACAILSKCLEENEYSLVVSKRHMESQVENIERVQQELSVLHANVKKIQDNEMWS